MVQKHAAAALSGSDAVPYIMASPRLRYRRAPGNQKLDPSCCASRSSCGSVSLPLFVKHLNFLLVPEQSECKWRLTK